MTVSRPRGVEQEATAKLPDNKELNSARRKKEAERLNTLVDKMQVG